MGIACQYLMQYVSKISPVSVFEVNIKTLEWPQLASSVVIIVNFEQV